MEEGIQVISVAQVIEGRPQSSPSFLALMVRAEEKVSPIFDSTARRGAQRRGTLFVVMLLCLKGKEVIEPFDGVQLLQEGEGMDSLVPDGPVHQVKLRALPVVVLAEIVPIVL